MKTTRRQRRFYGVVRTRAFEPTTRARAERIVKDALATIGWIAVGGKTLTRASSPREIRLAVVRAIVAQGGPALMRALLRHQGESAPHTLGAQKPPGGKPRPKPGPPSPPPDDDDPEREYPGPRKRP